MGTMTVMICSQEELTLPTIWEKVLILSVNGDFCQMVFILHDYVHHICIFEMPQWNIKKS